MDDFISEDDLLTFEGFLKYQGANPDPASPEEVKMWREMFDRGIERRKTTPKVGLMKLQPVPGEEKYAVAIRDGSNLWLTMWVRCSRKGEVFIMYPRGDRDWDAHASYHLDGTLHQKSHGKVVLAVNRQPFTAGFSGTENLGVYAGHGGRSIGAVCDPAMFNGVVVVEPGILGPRDGAVAIDLVGPGGQPLPFIGKVIQKQIFPGASDLR